MFFVFCWVWGCSVDKSLFVVWCSLHVGGAGGMNFGRFRHFSFVRFGVCGLSVRWNTLKLVSALGSGPEFD